MQVRCKRDEVQLVQGVLDKVRRGARWQRLDSTFNLMLNAVNTNTQIHNPKFEFPNLYLNLNPRPPSDTPRP